MKDNSAEKIFEKIIQFADVKNKQVLEIGCGDGRITAYLARKPKKLVAIDPDKEQLEDARNKVKGVKFQVGSGENIAFPSNYFDLVIFTLSLHHQNSVKAISEACRVLKDKGKILIIEPKIEGEIEQLFSLLHNEDEDKIKAQDAVKNSGLTLEKSENFSADWFFDNKDDLFKSAFEYYDLPFDLVIASKMADMLGQKADANPLVLSDLMIIQSLKK